MNERIKGSKAVLYAVLALTWCALQTLIGGVLAAVLFVKARFQYYRGMILVYHPFSFTFSLGTFAFVSDGVPHPRTIRGRMFGHFAQSLLYGPLFLFVVPISQLIVRIPLIKSYRAERGRSPESVFADRQAAELQAKFGE